MTHRSNASGILNTWKAAEAVSRSFYNTDPLFYLSSFFPKGNPRCDNPQRGFSCVRLVCTRRMATGSNPFCRFLSTFVKVKQLIKPLRRYEPSTPRFAFLLATSSETRRFLLLLCMVLSKKIVLSLVPCYNPQSLYQFCGKMLSTFSALHRRCRRS